MASFASFLLLSLFFLNFVSSFAAHGKSGSFSASFPLTSVPIARGGSSARKVFASSLMGKRLVPRGSAAAAAAGMRSLNYKSSFKYSMALVVTLPIGTPPQNQQMVLDTGSQLSWIQCNKKVPRKPPPTAAFDPSLSSSFSVLPCSHPMCKPRIPDFTLPTTCDQNRLCHYSYFYADGTLAEGNLVREKFSFPNSQTTPPLVLGCAAESAEAQGILGMNTGRLSFASQAKIQKFSYCVPVRQPGRGINPTGAFYLGRNPNSPTFQYINLLTFSQTQRRSPNLDPLAYTVGFTGIKIGGKKLNISAAVFRPDSGGSGQTMIDSGTQYTFLVNEAYNKVREEVVRLAGSKLKKDYAYAGALDMCFDGNPTEIGRLIGDMTFEFENRVDLVVNRDRISDNVEGGVHCLGIGRSESLGVASNIIGNFHQQNLWVEFDLIRRRIGFGKADCSKAV